jgi:3-oxoacyl-[acyl-carrier protein] reductase
MDLGIAGRRAVVIGASEGIGLATAEGLAREGVEITIVARSAKKLSVAVEAIRIATGAVARAVTCDICAPHEVQSFARAQGDAPIDILVVAVGASRRAEFEALGDSDWRESYEVNLLGPARIVRALLPAVKRGERPSLILLGGAGAKQPYAHQVVSNVHKAGILALTKTLAAELAPDGIRVNSVCPGRTMTALWRTRLDDLSRREGRSAVELQEEFAREIPLGRFASADEIANVIVFLSSSRAAYVTGQSISVDGGITRGLL